MNVSKAILVIVLNIQLLAFNGFSQSNISTEINLSQNSNYFLCSAQISNSIFISSTDGLNIYDGLQTKVYRPSTHHMYGYNVQSNFFEDSTGKVWFTTYEALNFYDSKIDDLNYYFMISSSGDTIKENYKAFYLDNNDLYLRAGNNVFVFDIEKHKIKELYNINISNYFQLALIPAAEGKILFAGDQGGFKVYHLGQNNSNRLMAKDSILNVSSVFPASGEDLWVGQSDGTLSLYNVTNGFVAHYPISKVPLSGITALGSQELILSTFSSELLEFDLTSRSVTQIIHPVNYLTKEPIRMSLPPYLDKDSTLWVGGDGQGVFFYNLNKSKFDHFLKSDPNQGTSSVVKIIQKQNNSFVVLTRRDGIYLLSAKGDQLIHWSTLPTGKLNFTALTGTLLDENQLLFWSTKSLFVLNFNTEKISAINKLFTAPFNIEQIEKLASGKIIASCDSLLFQEIVIGINGYSLKPYGDLQSHASQTTFFGIDQGGDIYVSNDEVNLLVLALTADGQSHHYAYSLPVSGGIGSLYEDIKQHAVYISNSQGLSLVNNDTKQITRVIDKDKHLSQNIYAALPDAHGNLWLSTNSGLMRYSPVNSEVKVFSEMDGVQAQEFNSHAYLKTHDGHMLFGGINGLNYFNPDEVRLSSREAPVYISEFLINDEFDTTYRVPQHIEKLTLPYAGNTFSFSFHAIDYSDPSATRVQYKLVGIDHDYIQSKEQQGFARYANLRPGQYTFFILGKNSDGVLNQSPKEIQITILPPFWQTLWFLSFISISTTAIIYWLFRSYFKRKIEKQNQLLREQALIIEKQQAVEHERTRIASEMHDDLGSGLTTIRYLSDKALKQAKDAEEAGQIQRIADHSNTLVRNMSEIIWAMNSRFDNIENLTGYLRRYASEFLEEHKIPLQFETSENGLTNEEIGGEKRRNLFLVFKEVLHNTIKYSNAKAVQILMNIDDHFVIKISEIDGIGFDPVVATDKGNGLYNCQKRMDMIQGTISYSKTVDTMDIIISTPLNPIPGE